MKKAFVALSFLLLPSLALAAGFAKDSLFLSKSPATEGEAVKIYAIVANPTNAAFKGSVVLSDGASKIASIDVVMEAGATQTTSASWKPLAGTHTIKAELTSTDGTVVEQESQTVTIASKPKPAAVVATTEQSAAVVGSSDDIQKSIANVSPQVAGATAPIFTVIDGARSGAADVLDTQIANTKESLAKTQKPGLVLGTSTKAIADPIIKNPWGSFWYFLYTVYLYILTALRWLVGNAGIFYPVFAILFLYILWRIFRRIRRPSY
jgi:hypothetical protein